VNELPKGWVSAAIGDLIEIGPRNYCDDQLEVGFVPLQRLGVDYRSVHSFEIRRWGDVKTGYTHFANGDVLLARITPSFENGKAGIAQGLPNGLGAGSTEYIVCRPFERSLASAYLLAFFKTPRFLKEGENLMSGAVGQQRVPKQYVHDCQIALAPIDEQKRIADKLDAVLARVDACRERMNRIPAILKRFRQSVLAAAASGKLTEEWRKNNGISISEQWQSYQVSEPYAHVVTAPLSWKRSTLGDVCEFIGGSQPPKSTFVHKDGPGLIRLIQIRDYKSDKHITFIPKALAKRFCSPTDVMVGRYGPPLFQILRGLDGAYNVALMKAQPRISDLILEYLFVFLRGDALLKYVEAGSDRTAGQDGVRKELLNPYPFFLPSVPEQSEIVRRVETLFAFADRLEARHVAARERVERLTPSLLAKAFRGELVPQDPNDEPASELLKRIQAVRAAKPEKPKRGMLGKGSKRKKVEATMLSRGDVQPNHLAVILTAQGPLTSEALWAASQLDIDDFYDQLKAEEESGLLKERRGNSTSETRLLEAA
jgi:type I restriction enzyme S subunit